MIYKIYNFELNENIIVNCLFIIDLPTCNYVLLYYLTIPHIVKIFIIN